MAARRRSSLALPAAILGVLAGLAVPAHPQPCDNSAFESTGQLGAVTISDHRNQSQPGWSISGQVSDFSDGTDAFSGSDLGWTPVVTMQNEAQDVVAAAAVTPGTEPGLKGGSGLASAAAAAGFVAWQGRWVLAQRPCQC